MWKSCHHIRKTNKLLNLSFSLITQVSDDFIKLKELIILVREVKKFHDSELNFLHIVINLKIRQQVLFTRQEDFDLNFLKLKNCFDLNNIRHDCSFSHTRVFHQTQQGKLSVLLNYIVFLILKSRVNEI